MKKFIAFLVIGFILICGIVTLFEKHNPAYNVNNTDGNSQIIASDNASITAVQPSPTVPSEKSSAYYEALVNQYSDKVREATKDVDFLQNNYDSSVSRGNGSLSAQGALNAAKNLLATYNQALENYKLAYNQAKTEGR